MNTQQIQEVFSAQTENVNELSRAWKSINRDVNQSYLKNQTKSVEHQTKMMAVVYCAFAEAKFSKLIHTPRCLTSDEISQIKGIVRNNGVKNGWLKLLDLALKRVEGQKSGHAPNVKQSISRLIDRYIFDPSVLRNKLAHGQWVKALNRENDAINNSITSEIINLSVVELYNRKYALEKLSSMMLDIIESPTRAHPRDYWLQTCELETTLDSRSQWTVEEKVAKLKLKYSKRPNPV